MGADTAAEAHPTSTPTRRARVVEALRDPLVDITILLAVVALTRTLDVVGTHLRTSDFIDLDVYRMGGQALIDRVPLYETHYKVLGLPFTYTPFAAIVFAPLATLRLDAAATIWLTISVLALLRVCWLVARELRDRWTRSVPTPLIALALYLVAMHLEPVDATLQFGQVNLIIMWLICEDMLRRRGRKAGGVLLGIATGIKLVPGLFIVVLLLTRRTREAIVALATTALTIGAGFVFQPDQAWQYWTGIAYDSGRVGGVAYISNQSFNGVITRFTQPGGSKVLWLLLAGITAAATVWAARRLWLNGARLLSIAIVATGSLLFSPISWSHHWVWFIVIIGALLDPVAGPRLVRWTMVALIYLVSVTYAIWQVPNSEDKEYLHTAWQRVQGNAYTWLAIATLVIGVIAAWRLPAPAPAERRERTTRSRGARDGERDSADPKAGAGDRDAAESVDQAEAKASVPVEAGA